MEHAILAPVLAIIGAGVASQWLAWRLRIPAIVVLLAVGLLVGPVTGLLDPGRDFAGALSPLVGLAVALIVFEGGLNLNLAELRSAGQGVRRLTLLALPLNWLLGSLAAHWIGGLAWPVAVLFGAILVVTGPTVILPLLRVARLKRRPAAFLKWEGVVNDPFGAILALLVLEFLMSVGRRDDGALATELLLRLAAGLAASVVLAAAAAWGVRWAFRHDQAPEVLKTPILLSLALVLYALANAIQPEAGLLAATVFGLALANLHIAGLHELSRFKESLTVLLVSGLFIVLTADLDPALFGRLSWPIAALTAAVLLLVRPMAIWLATLGSDMSWRERLLVGWIGPRGIVAAAVAGVAGSELTRAGYAGAELIQPTVFAVIAATVVLHGLTIGPLARRLGLSTADRPGLLILGASDWSLDLACCLHRLRVPVVMADPSWAALGPARKAGLPTIGAELLSETVADILGPGPVDYLFAATGDDSYNALVCARLAPELGRERVNQLALQSGRLAAHATPSREWRGKIVSEQDLDFPTLDWLFHEGWRFHSRRVEASEQGKAVHSYATEEEKPFLVVKKGGALRFFSPEQTLHLAEGDCLVGLRRG